MTDILPIVSVLLGAVNLSFVLKIILSDLSEMKRLMEKHRDFCEQLHRDQERRLVRLETLIHQPPA